MPSPVCLATRFEIECGRWTRRRLTLLRGPGRAYLDPFGERRNLAGGKLPGGRHLEQLSAEGLNQAALIGAAGYDNRARFASSPQALRAIEVKLGEDGICLRAVTLIAVLRQQRSHIGLKELDLLGGGSSRRSSAKKRWAEGKECAQQAGKNAACEADLSKSVAAWQEQDSHTQTRQ